MLCRWRLITNGLFQRSSLQCIRTATSTGKTPPLPKTKLPELKPSDKKIMKRVLAKIENTKQKPSRCTPEDIWRVLFACSKIDGTGPVLQRTVKRVNAQMMRRATAKDLGLFMECLGRLHRKQRVITEDDWDAAVECVLYEIRLHHPVRRFVVDDAVRVIAAMAAIEIQDESLVRSYIERHILKTIPTLSGYRSSTLLWALVKMGIQEPDWLHELSKVTIRKWSSMKFQEMTTTIQTWTHKGEDFKAYVQKALALTVRLKSIPDIKIKHCITFLNCLVRLQLREEKQVIEFLTENLLEHIKDEKPKRESLATVVWVLGQLRYRTLYHVNLLAEEVVRPGVLSQLTMQGLCRVATGWAYACVVEEQYIDILAEEALSASRQTSIENDHLVALNWSLGKLKLQQRSLIDRLIGITSKMERVQAYTNQQLCTILEGWKLLTIQDDDAISVLAREAVVPSRLESYTSSQVGHLIWCIGSLHAPHMIFFKNLRRELGMRTRIEQLTAEDVKRAFQGFLLGGYHDVTLAYVFGDIFQHWLTSGKLNEADTDDLTSIRSTLKQLPYIEPMHIHQIGRELDRRKTENLL